MEISAKNAELKLMIATMTNDVKSHNDIILKVLDSEFYIPFKIDTPTEVMINGDSKAEINAKRSAYIPTIKSRNNEIYCPLFTDAEEVEKYRAHSQDNAETPMNIVSFRNIAAFIENNPTINGLIINPMGKSLVFNELILSEIKSHLKIKK